MAVWIAIPVRFSQSRQVPADLLPSPQDSLRDRFERGFAALRELKVAVPCETDSAARADLIRTALRLDPPPRLPDAAQALFDRGRRTYARCACRDSACSALISYQAALHEAPWWGPPYLGAGRMLQRLDQPRLALVSYRLYLLAEPGALQAEEVLKDMMKLELKLARRR
jgi:hypothetical protein